MSTERASSGPLPVGTVVGGRFEVQSDRLTDRLGVILQCRDQKTEKPIALRLLRPGLMDGAGMKILRAECRTAARLSHPAIITTFGVGSAGGHTFVATSWLQGEPLPVRIAARPAAAPISLGSAFTIISELCRALTAAQPKTSHGALRPSAVWISDEGAVQLTGFGVDRTLLATRSASVFAAEEQACFAPEVKAGAPPTAAADIFGLGAILYMLLTGKSPADGFVPPSQVHPQAKPGLDRLLLMCLAADPAQRFASPDEVRNALQPLVTHDNSKSLTEDFAISATPISPTPPSDELGLDIDIDLGSGFPDPGPHAPEVAVPPSGGVPQVGARVSIHEQFRPSLPEPAQAQAQAQAQGADLGQLLKKVAENDSHRWMVDKDGLSHGPFDGRELVELILKGEVVEDHVLLNMDTGEKKPIQQWPDFREFVSDYKLRKRQSDRKTALADAERTQKRSGTTKLVLGGVVLVGLVASIVAFVVTRDSQESTEVADSELGELFAHGEIELEGTAGILPDPPRRTGMGGMGRPRGMGGGGFAGSYEDAMNRAVELGDVTMSGGQGRLSPAQVSGVLNRHVNRIYQRCVVPEASRGGRLGNVTIDVAIAGSGSVLGVSARQGSGAFKSCVRGAVRRVRFPSFGAPRMGARYSFDASP